MSDLEPRSRNPADVLTDPQQKYETYGLVAEEIEAAIAAGRVPDTEAIIQQHPELASEIRELIATLQTLNDLRQNSADHHNANPEHSQPLGQLGDFQILREIGRGGMGVVYEARQISLKRRVALKVLPFAAVLDKRQLQRFHTEAMAAARLHHPHIVPVYQVGCERAVHFYAMQYIQGRNVAELLRGIRQGLGQDADGDADAGAPLPAPAPGAAPSAGVETAVLQNLSTDYSTNKGSYHRQIAAFGVQVAEALDFAHEHGILHRDIKPSNLMLDDRGDLWITDFGLARIEGDNGLTMSGDLLGTLRYMSPEQVLGKRVIIDERSDVYSLGTTLYEMLTLRPAYEGADRAELLRKISFEEPLPLRRMDSSIPADLETIILTATAHDPRRRYETAKAFADDLQRFLDHKPILARRPSRGEHTRKWITRNKPLSAALVLLLIAVVVAAAATWEALTQRRLAPATAAISGSRVPSLNTPSVPLPLARAAGRVLPGLIPDPPLIPDVGRWQLITKQPRGVIRSAVWNPDETLLALTEANHVRIYDLRSLLLLQVLVGHSQPATCVAWHPDGESLASASEDGTVRLWSRAGVPTHLLEGHTGPVYRVAWRPDGEQLASCSADGTVRLWNKDGKLVETLDEAGRHVFGIDWSADGKLLATVGGDIRPVGVDGDVGDNSLRIWNADTGKLVRRIPSSVGYSALCVDWRPDGEQLAVGYGYVYRQMHGVTKPLPDAGIRIWNEDGTPGPEVGLDKGSVSTIAWDAIGERLAFGGRHRIVWVWNSTDQQSTAIDVEQKFEFFSLSWSQDNTRLLIGNRDSVFEWDGQTTVAPLAAGIGRNVGFSSGSWSPDGTIVAGEQNGSGFKFWSRNGAPVPTPERPAGNEPSWWERHTPTRRPDGTSAPPLEGGPTADVYTKFAWSKDGWLAAATWHDQTVKIWDHQGKLIATCRGHRGGVESVSWSPDGTQVVSGGGDSVRIWNRDGTAGPVMTGHTDEVYGVAWSPDGRWIASGSTDSTVRLWKTDGTPGAVLKGHQGGVMGVGWSPDSQKLVSASWLDNTLRVWDFASGKTEWQALRLDDAATIRLNPAEFLIDGDADVLESSLFYGVERRDGTLELLTPSEFRKRHKTTLLSMLAQHFAKLLETHELGRSEAELALALTLRADVTTKGRVQIAKLAEQLADALYFEREYGRAEHAMRTSIEVQEQVVAESPEDPTQKDQLSYLWLRRGEVLSATGRNTDALAAFTKAIESNHEMIKVDPSNKAVSRSLAIRFYERAQRQPTFDAAMADLDRVVDIDPAFTYGGWSLIYFLDDLVEKPADTAADHAREIPAEQQVEIAKAVFIEAVRRLPKMPNQFLFADWLSSAPERFRDPQLALQLAERALELDPPDEECQESVAWSQYRLGDSQACLATLGKITGDRIENDFIRAMAYLSLGNTSEARAAFDRGTEWSKGYLQDIYIQRWSDHVPWHPTPGMLRRLQAEAAAMLSAAENKQLSAVPVLPAAVNSQ